MGDEYKVQIICIINSRAQEGKNSINIQEFLSETCSNLHFISSNRKIQTFISLNRDIQPRKNFTCLTLPDGSVLHVGGNPKKDLEVFEEYTDYISNYNNNH